MLSISSTGSTTWQKMNQTLDDVRAEEARRNETRRVSSSPEEIPLALAQAPREPHKQEKISPSRPPSLQPEERQGLSSQGSLSANLGLQLPGLGWKVPR